jgi:hypothetical protein
MMLCDIIHSQASVINREAAAWLQQSTACSDAIPQGEDGSGAKKPWDSNGPFPAGFQRSGVKRFFASEAR